MAPNSSAQNPDSISWTFLEQFVLVIFTSASILVRKILLKEAAVEFPLPELFKPRVAGGKI